ncbi:hypothetical protein ACFW9F_27165 [Streptomyces sp. NPDC059506]|uniref:SecDF P1 head subdomain-containing protein n=1 Tax=Streptomyces sp. NPDC059506 TaxID=3347751 RepID=UPI0036D17157
MRSVEAVGVLDRTAEGQGWVVEVTLRDEDADRFSDLTGRLAERPEPKNGVAVVLGDRLIAHPVVAERLTNPTVQIAVGLGRAEARGQADSLGAPRPPPGPGAAPRPCLINTTDAHQQRD